MGQVQGSHPQPADRQGNPHYHERVPERDHDGGRCSPGKLLSLVAHLRTHPEDLEADFQQFYGLDLGGLYRGELKPLRAARLAESLPPQARVRRGSEVNATWMSLEEQLLTALVNLTRVQVWQNTEDGQKGRNVPDLIPLPSEVLAATKQHEENAAKAKALKARLERRKVG